jgi:hypothetical protein
LKMIAHTRQHACTMHHPAISSNLDAHRINRATCEWVKAPRWYPGRAVDGLHRSEP